MVSPEKEKTPPKKSKLDELEDTIDLKKVPLSKDVEYEFYYNRQKVNNFMSLYELMYY